MKLIFKQRIFSWLDSYDIYDEFGNVYFSVEGKLYFGHSFNIYDKNKCLVGKLKQKIFTFLPVFEIYDGQDKYLGSVTKNFTFFKPSFSLDYHGLEVTGDWFEWDYEIRKNGKVIASINKELFRFSDTYQMNVSEYYAFDALMIVLAIDAVKCCND